MLGDWHGDSDDVGFLESVGSNVSGRNLTGDCKHWNRVHVRIGDCGDQVGSTWTRGSDANAKFSRSGGVAFCCVTGALFVANQDMPDLLRIH